MQLASLRCRLASCVRTADQTLFTEPLRANARSCLGVARLDAETAPPSLTRWRGTSARRLRMRMMDARICLHTRRLAVRCAAVIAAALPLCRRHGMKPAAALLRSRHAHVGLEPVVEVQEVPVRDAASMVGQPRPMLPHALARPETHVAGVACLADVLKARLTARPEDGVTASGRDSSHRTHWTWSLPEPSARLRAGCCGWCGRAGHRQTPLGLTRLTHLRHVHQSLCPG